MIYPIAHLHITIATLYNFKHPRPVSPKNCLNYWKQHFAQLNAEYALVDVLIASTWQDLAGRNVESTRTFWQVSK